MLDFHLLKQTAPKSRHLNYVILTCLWEITIYVYCDLLRFLSSTVHKVI